MTEFSRQRERQSTPLAAIMERFRARMGVERGEDTVPERWKCMKCDAFVDEPAGEKCGNPGWHGRRVVPEPRERLMPPGADPNCSTCHGDGYGKWENYDYTHPQFGRAIPCPKCRASFVERSHVNAVLSSIPPRFQGAELPDFIGPRDVLGWITDWLERGNPEIPWLVLYGERGRGKTWLAAAVFKHLLADGSRSGVFIDVGDLFNQLRFAIERSRRDDESADLTTEGILRALYEADVLVLDDLSTEPPTRYVESELYKIFNSRYQAMKTTIVTMNPEPDAMSERSENMGRIISRMIEVACQVEVSGPDLREAAKQRRRDEQNPLL